MRFTLAALFCLGVQIASAGPLHTISAASADGTGEVGTAVGAFRTILGDLNPPGLGSVGSGRREVNWDGVPLALQLNHPGNFFNSNSPRGVVSTTPGTSLSVSRNDDPTTLVDEARFGDVQAEYANQFKAFSNPRLFTSIGSNVLDIFFFVPGTDTPALVSGFGAIFTDVDLADTTRMQTFDRNGNITSDLFAPVFGGGLSFLAANVDSADDAPIARVRITMGNMVFGGLEDPGGILPTDVVVVDDFIYGEPIDASIPEPSSALLLAPGLACIAYVVRQRRAK